MIDSDSQRTGGLRLTLVAWALLLTAAVGLFSGMLEERYYSGHSYYYDPVSYLFHNARLAELVKEKGRLAVAARELAENERHPLRTTPLILAWPELLAKRWGHMATSLPALAVFLAIFAHTLRRRTASTAYAMAGSALFCVAPALYDPKLGLGAYQLDLTAALWLGGAVCCLLGWLETRRLGWLAGFALLASMAALSRYVAAAYAVFMTGPPLAMGLLANWRREGFGSGLLLPLLALGAVLAVGCGWFLAGHLAEVADFYSRFGYDLGRGVVPAAYAAWQWYISHVGLMMLGLLLVCLVAGLLGPGRLSLGDAAALAWMALAQPLFVVLVIRTVHSQVPVYALPPLFLLCLTPIYRPDPDGLENTGRRALALMLAGLMLVGAVWMGWRYGYGHFQASALATRAQLENKRFETALAEKLAQEKKDLVWLAVYDEHSWIPAMEAYHRWGRLAQPAGQDHFFSVHPTVWRAGFPNMAPDAISQKVMARLKRYVDLVVAYQDPSQAADRIKDPVSRRVAENLARDLAADPAWEKAFTLAQTTYGPLVGYRNRAGAEPGGYARLLSGSRLLGRQSGGLQTGSGQNKIDN